MGGQRHAPALLPQGKPGSRSTGGWVGTQGRSGQVRKNRPHRDSISRPSSPKQVAIHFLTKYVCKNQY